MAKILIVEDDVNLVETIREHLRREHHTVESVVEGDVALDLMRSFAYDVIILDLSLPKLDGVDVCRQYRLSGGSARILMLTGRESLEAKEIGLDVGADDYLTKPFHVKELLARVRALMRRSLGAMGDELSVGNVTLRPRTFYATKDGVELVLTPREFALLEFLMRHPNELFSSDALLDRVWKSDTEASPYTVKSYIHRIREKLGHSPGTPTIATSHGVGYRLIPPQG